MSVIKSFSKLIYDSSGYAYDSADYIKTFIIVFIVIYIKWKLLKGIWTCGLGYALGFGVKWRPAPDNWAVVTGGTDGIGLEYAKQFANMGYSILILSRSEEKLKKVADDIKNAYPQCKAIETLAVDFRRTDIYPMIAEVINSLETIDVLVNNVGVLCGPTVDYFALTPPSMNDTYINVNIVSYVRMCEIILPKMVDQQRGIIINVSAFVAEHLAPILTVFSATKYFDDALSMGLTIEYASKGIIVQSVLPGPVRTKLLPEVLLRHRVVRLLHPLVMVSAKDFVSAAIKTVGIEWHTYGHWKHKLLIFTTVRLVMILGRKIVFKIVMLPVQWTRYKTYKMYNIKNNS